MSISRPRDLLQAHEGEFQLICGIALVVLTTARPEGFARSKCVTRQSDLEHVGC